MVSNGSPSIKTGILFLVPAALALILLFVFAGNWNSYKSKAIPVKGVVTQAVKSSKGTSSTNIAGRSTSYIEGVYTVDGTEYTVRTNYDGFIRKGQKITYYYPAGMPDEGKPAPVGSFAVTGLIAAFFGAIGAAGIGYGMKEKREYKKFIADCAEISFDSWEEASAGSGSTKYCLFRYNDPSGESFEFRSDYFPEGKCPFVKGVPVTVLVDTDNPSKYFIKQDKK